MKQSEIMLASEGNAWFARNERKLGKRDPVSETLELECIRPTRALEIGCANGWRLAKLRDKHNCLIFGVEPSQEAAIDAAGCGVPVYQCTADRLPFVDDAFDLVIYGHCLYQTDPVDWFRITMEGDRVLQAGGHLIVHDFADCSPPFARRNEHCEDMLSYHVDFAKFWLASPLYSVVGRLFGDETVTILKKSAADAIEVRA